MLHLAVKINILTSYFSPYVQSSSSFQQLLHYVLCGFDVHFGTRYCQYYIGLLITLDPWDCDFGLAISAYLGNGFNSLTDELGYQFCRYTNLTASVFITVLESLGPPNSLIRHTLLNFSKHCIGIFFAN